MGIQVSEVPANQTQICLKFKSIIDCCHEQGSILVILHEETKMEVLGSLCLNPI